MRQIYARLEQLLSQPDMRHFGRNREDIRVSDRYVLEVHGAAQARWLWIVDAQDTTLVRLGVHPRASDWGFAALAVPGPRRIFLATAAGVREVDDAQAIALLRHMRFAIEGSTILRDGEPVAKLLIERVGQGRTRPTLRIVLSSLVELDRDLMTSLYLFAVKETSRVHEAFQRIAELALDGVPLLPWIEATAVAGVEVALRQPLHAELTNQGEPATI